MSRAPAVAPVKPATVVPNVVTDAFVFAKTELDDDGFAWVVRGDVHGFAGNRVVEQSPPAGTRVVDTGAPIVAVRLRRGPGYRESGEPEDTSPYLGTPLRVAPAR